MHQITENQEQQDNTKKMRISGGERGKGGKYEFNPFLSLYMIADAYYHMSFDHIEDSLEYDEYIKYGYFLEKLYSVLVEEKDPWHLNLQL
jgi:hypothetical protein